jgi:NDP-4-keto-2,6-dideoxyhexose 3-C-methyltransferase
MIREISACRICGNTHLAPLLDLGNQVLTGVFPKSKTQDVGIMPLQLVKCDESGDGGQCGLLQLRHTGDLSAMYGQNYGYRSGLNQSMVKHLHAKVKKILMTVKLSDGDLVIDIGSNDSSLLQAYPEKGVDLVGIDPTGLKFKKYYPPHIRLISDFFSGQVVRDNLGGRRAKIITSISMFYDLEDPMAFVSQIADVLADDGVWVLEQSYMPTMLEMNSYDTICHEHLEYYGLKQIKWLLDRNDMQIIDVEFNMINGGSFSLMVSKKAAPYPVNAPQIETVLQKESDLGLSTLKPYREFEQRVSQHRNELKAFLAQYRKEGKKVFGYGASTKGNVLLQYCGITTDDLPCIAEVNEDKFGAYTPGTLIPIVSEAEARRLKPDYFLVLPWHFRDSIVARETSYLSEGGKLVFPLPTLQIVGG